MKESKVIPECCLDPNTMVFTPSGRLVPYGRIKVRHEFKCMARDGNGNPVEVILLERSGVCMISKTNNDNL